MFTSKTANVDTCHLMIGALREPCMECKLIKEDEIQETNKLRQLLDQMKKNKEKEFRKLVGGTI